MLIRTVILISVLFAHGLASALKEQKSLAVTIYSNAFAMVKDVRSIQFDQGTSSLYFTDVSSNIQTETVTFKPIGTKSQISVFEQNFQRNLINKQSILKKYLQKQIKLYVKLGQNSKLVKGKLLGYEDGYIVKTQNGIDVFNNIDSIQFPELPQGFFTVPTLSWKVYSKEQITSDCQVAYRTTGFSWKADYSITLNQAETLADIGGWVTIDNNSGKKYVNAKLKLIAGDVNTVAPTPKNRQVFRVLPMASAAFTTSSPPSFSEKSFADYHLYTLSQPVTLNQSSQKQVQFIPKVYGISVRKYHLINLNVGGYGVNNVKVQNNIGFLNSKNIGLGIPLPKGTVRVFKQDKDDGSLQFVGEDKIGHTPKEQNITISTGNSFDIVTNVYSESRQNLKNGGYIANMNMTITNHKETAVEIQVVLANYYGDNLKIKWNSKDSNLLKSSSNQYKLNINKLRSNETFTAKWEESYFP